MRLTNKRSKENIMKGSKILCPFCKNKNPDLLIPRTIRYKIQMECVECSARGPVRSTEEEAYNYWQKICNKLEQE